jgi:hypothetical protein
MKTAFLGVLHGLELARYAPRGSDALRFSTRNAHTPPSLREKKALFLQASTSEVYGDPLEHPQKETYWGET